MIVLKCYLIACYLFITLVMSVAIHSAGNKPEKRDLKIWLAAPLTAPTFFLYYIYQIAFKKN
jgi:hypothetical protein